MAKIRVGVDCGNSPRKAFLKDFHIAWANGDAAYLVDHVDDRVTWEVVGERTIQGKAAFDETVRNALAQEIVELDLMAVITHGTDAAAQGIRTLANGRRYSFCDVYVFRGSKGTTLKSITSYVIDVSKG